MAIWPPGASTGSGMSELPTTVPPTSAPAPTAWSDTSSTGSRWPASDSAGSLPAGARQEEGHHPMMDGGDGGPKETAGPSLEVHVGDHHDGGVAHPYGVARYQQRRVGLQGERISPRAFDTPPGDRER